MKSKLLFSLTLGSALLATGCGSDTYNTSNAPAVAYTSKAQAQADGKIVGGIIVLDQNEMNAAALAQNRAANPAVKNYANYMYNEHSRNLQAVQGMSQRLGVTPTKGHIAMMLQNKGRNLLAKLKHLNGPTFDRAYMTAMVKDHSEALQILDHKLIPMAVNPMVKRNLEITRNHVAEHLQKAQMILKQS